MHSQNFVIEETLLLKKHSKKKRKIKRKKYSPTLTTIRVKYGFLYSLRNAFYFLLKNFFRCKFWILYTFKINLTKEGIEPSTSGLWFRRSANWTISSLLLYQNMAGLYFLLNSAIVCISSILYNKVIQFIFSL